MAERLWDLFEVTTGQAAKSAGSWCLVIAWASKADEHEMGLMKWCWEMHIVSSGPSQA